MNSPPVRGRAGAAILSVGLVAVAVGAGGVSGLTALPTGSTLVIGGVGEGVLIVTAWFIVGLGMAVLCGCLFRWLVRRRTVGFEVLALLMLLAAIGVGAFFLYLGAFVVALSPTYVKVSADDGETFLVRIQSWHHTEYSLMEQRGALWYDAGHRVWTDDPDRSLQDGRYTLQRLRSAYRLVIGPNHDGKPATFYWPAE